MDSPTSKAPSPALKAGPVTAIPEPGITPAPSQAADYVYRIAAMTAGIALLATFI